MIFPIGNLIYSTNNKTLITLPRVILLMKIFFKIFFYKHKSHIQLSHFCVVKDQITNRKSSKKKKSNKKKNLFLLSFSFSWRKKKVWKTNKTRWWTFFALSIKIELIQWRSPRNSSSSWVFLMMLSWEKFEINKFLVFVIVVAFVDPFVWQMLFLSLI